MLHWMTATTAGIVAIAAAGLALIGLVANRVIMLYPLARLQPGQPQVIFDGTPEELTRCADPRVRSFVEGDARGRLEAPSDEVRLPDASVG